MSIPIIGALIDAGSGFLRRRQERKRTETEGKIAEIERADDKVAAWEKIMARGSQSSWKDEFWTVILAIPMVMCFIPPLLPYVTDGFAALSTMPEWYRWFLGVAISAAFGVRQFNKGVK